MLTSIFINMNIKKFIKEEIGMSDGVNDEFDFIRDVIPGIRKGMLLCNQYGDQWEVLDTDQTNTGKKLLILLTKDDNVRTQPKPYTADYIIDRIINGTLTICDTLKEEIGDFDWAKEVTTNPFLLEKGGNYYIFIDISLTEKQSRLIWDWLVEAGVTTEYKVIQHNRVEKLTKLLDTFMIINSDGSFSYAAKHLPDEARKILKISDFFNKKENLKEEQLNLFGEEGKDDI